VRASSPWCWRGSSASPCCPGPTATAACWRWRSWSPTRPSGT
jgi:hypothetical protein